MLIVTLAIRLIGDLRGPKRPSETGGWRARSGHLNFAQSGHFNLAAIFAGRITDLLVNRAEPRDSIGRAERQKKLS
jgi:hypothetical protein